MARGRFVKKPLIYLAISLAFVGMIVLYLFSGNPGQNIVRNVRLPRLILTVVTGMSLAAVGSVYQLMLGNPLADPYILGVSSGSALGSIIFASLGLIVLMPLGGFIGAMLTMVLVWRLALKDGVFDKGRLIIAGVVAGMFFSSWISLLMYLSREDTVLILSTLMGNLGRIFSYFEYRVFLGLSLLVGILIVWLYLQSRALDIMSTSDNYAQSVGIGVQALRKKIFWVSSLIIGIVVSFAGIIGFVGLITPHIMRMLGFNKQSEIFPGSMLFGAGFLLMSDFLAKNIGGIELPVGVITAAVGCPFFAYLLVRK